MSDTAPQADGQDSAGEVPLPKVRGITLETVVDALGRGVRDFQRAPQYGLGIGGFYALAGLSLLLLAYEGGYVFVIYPLAAGFALLGPFAAVGLYEVSRRLESGEPLSWGVLYDVAIRKGRGRLGWMPMITLFAFFIWLDFAMIIYAVFFGIRFASITVMIGEIFGTMHGLFFLVLGNAAGALFAGTIFSISVIGYPILLDRDTDFITAIVTSMKCVLKSPRPMLSYALCIVFLLLAGLAPAFLGLIITLPVLGHATWHLYRACVE